jgi:hypothetical protein
VICRDPPSVLLLSLSVGGIGWLAGEETAIIVATAAIAIIIPATIASLVPLCTIFHDI